VLFSIVASVGSGDVTTSSRIAVRDLKTGQTKVLIQGGTSPHYAASGHLVYAAAGTLRAVPFDADRLEVYGNPGPVLDHLAIKSGAVSSALASFAVASTSRSEARDTRIERTVASLGARFHLVPQTRERFRREARAVAALQHPRLSVASGKNMVNVFVVRSLADQVSFGSLESQTKPRRLRRMRCSTVKSPPPARESQ
jgi:hypothetical protein